MVHAIRPTVGTGIGLMLGGGLPGAVVGGVGGVAVPYAARTAILSGPGQSLLASPSYSQGILANLGTAGLLPSPEVAGILARTVVPAAYLSAKQ